MSRRFQMDECSIRLPDDYRDRTVNAVEWKTPEGDRIVLMIQRDPAPAGPADALPNEVLEAYVAAQTREYPKRFAGYRLERDEAASGDTRGLALVRRAFRSSKDHDTLYHHQAFILAGHVILVLTAAAQARHRERVDAVIDEALGDIHFRAD